ncbi:peroxiredoxin family protein [Hymenobacter rubripertinctus]|nr:TlpA disulfide reductase family protein [Hymenobacter rubripertinctus]
MRGFCFGLLFLLLSGGCQRLGAPAEPGAATANRQDTRPPAPDFTLPTAAGDSLTLSSRRGSFVLLDFRAADCADCRAENANLRKMYGQFRSRGLAIVSVWANSDPAEWRRAVAADSLAWPQVLDRPANPVAQAYAVDARPATVLLDPHGHELARNLHGRDLGQKIAEYIPLD